MPDADRWPIPISSLEKALDYQLLELSFTCTYPIGSMYGIFTNICPIYDPNVGKYSIHGSYGYYIHLFYLRLSQTIINRFRKKYLVPSPESIEKNDIENHRAAELHPPLGAPARSGHCPPGQGPVAFDQEMMGGICWKYPLVI